MKNKQAGNPDTADISSAISVPLDALSGLGAFACAAETRSFVAAGQRLGISASAVGKSVARLEQRLGVRLLNRSTRRISPTEEGARLFERCRRIFAELEDAQAELSQALGAPRGRLRVSLPAIGHRMLLPLLPRFAQAWPEVELDIDFNDRFVDLIDEGIDVAVRSGELADSQLMSRTLGRFRFVLAGSPSYFASRGVPAAVDALRRHACLRYRFPDSGQLQDWRLHGVASPAPLPASSALTCNSIEALIGAASAGMGIAYLPDFAVRASLESGALVTVLDAHALDSGRFSAVWPSSRHLLPKLRVFVDFIAEHLFPGPSDSPRVAARRRTR